MKILKKKGFTLVELLVVIAILAVLAAVSFVGYTAFIDRSKKSNDQMLIDQMNNILQGSEIIDDIPTSPNEAMNIVINNGYNGDFKPQYPEYEFGWDEDENRFVIIEDGEVVYPDEFKGEEKDDSIHSLEEAPEAIAKRLSEITDSDELRELGITKLDAGISFATQDTVASIEGKEYAGYFVDFVVSVNQDVDVNARMWGRFKDTGTGMASLLEGVEKVLDASVSINKDDEIHVMYAAIEGYMDAVPYELIVTGNDGKVANEDGKFDNPVTFDCGLIIDSINSEYSNLVITLELRLYHGFDTETKQYSSTYTTVGKYDFPIE